MKSTLRLFQNIKFNVGLFAALAIGSILGTLIPQSPENPQGVEEFVRHSPALAALFEKLSFFNIYYSWWFIGLLALLAFDVVVCKLIFGKFPGLRSFKPHESRPEHLLTLSFRREWRAASVEEAWRKITAGIESRGYRVVRSAPEAGGVVILAEKQPWQRFGSWISHVSILLILLANLLGALYGFRETLNVAEGTHEHMQHRPWSVFCDRFIVEWYENTDTPKTFASDLRLEEGGNVLSQKRILVNDPLEYRKVRFYQATYGPELKEAKIGVFLRKRPKQSPALRLKPNEEANVPGTDFSLRILRFVPDLSLNEKGQVGSRSVFPANPAVQVQISKKGRPQKSLWIFQNFPGMQMPPPEPDDEALLVLAEYVPAFYTGLQIAYDPGVDLFWSACALLVLGLAMLFYLHHRKLYFFLGREPSGEAGVRAGGFSSRGKSFEPEFARVIAAVQGEAGV